MPQRLTVLLGLTAALCMASARADLPLTVEDLITEKGKLKLDLTLAYANAERQGVSVGEPILIQTGPTAFVAVPTKVGASQMNSDTLVMSLGLRYGVAAKTELYGRASALASEQRHRGVAGETTERDSRLADAWVGVNHQFKKDDTTPALLGFVELALLERHRQDSASLKSALLGLTTYRAHDPVVLSLTAAWRMNSSRRDAGQDYEPGNLILITPSVGFAANDRVTLTTGLQWTHRQAERLDGVKQGMSRSATDLTLGVGYGFEKGNTLNLTARANVSGREGAEIRLNWLYTVR